MAVLSLPDPREAQHLCLPGRLLPLGQGFTRLVLASAGVALARDGVVEVYCRVFPWLDQNRGNGVKSQQVATRK
jgi:hypothetical protein